MRIRDIKMEYVIIFVLILLLLKSCPSKNQKPSISRTIKRDTVLIEKIDSMHKLFKAYKTQKPKIVYVKVKADELQRLPKEQLVNYSPKEEEELLKLNEYKDTLQNKEITIYSSVLTDGKIYENKLKYELKYPVVTETIVEKHKTPQSGLFLYSGIQGNNQQFRGVNIGLQYIHRNRWFVGYGVDFLQNPKGNHQVNIGVKLF